MNSKLICILTFASLTFIAACGQEPVLPDVSQATFVSGIDNPYLPFKTGATWKYESVTPDGTEEITVTVPGTTKTIQGVIATVVRDTARINNVITEDTTDWYAQDSEGNVWYLGEQTCVYENGICVDKEGSWEWGVKGALPGIALQANPKVDAIPYRQEYFPGHAEDVGEVLALNQSVNPGGSLTQTAGFKDCVETHDTSMIVDLSEFKFYCKGIGLALTNEGDVKEELVDVSGL